ARGRSWRAVRSVSSLLPPRRVGPPAGEMRLQAIEAPLEMRASARDPLLDFGERAVLDPAGPHAADFLRTDEPARLQHCEMLHHGGYRDRQRTREIAHGHG